MSANFSTPNHPVSRLRNRCSLFASLSDHHLMQLEASGAVRTYALGEGERIELRGVERDEVVYLLSGAVQIGGTDASETRRDGSCQPIPLPVGERVSLNASEPAWLCRTNRSHLDYVLGWTSLTQDTNHGNDGFQEFLERLHNPAVFRHLPLSNVEQAYQQMTRREVSAGEVIMKQGDPADDFYVIESGRAEIWQQGLYDDEQQLIAEIGTGDHFGGDALVSGGTRSATIRITEDGKLLVLSGEDFKALIKQPLVHEVDARVAQAMMDSREREVLDVRYEEEWQDLHLPGVTLMPLDQLRARLSELDAGKQYITYCRSGKRSAVAAMILAEGGIDAVSLRGGINEWPYETEAAA